MAIKYFTKEQISEFYLVFEQELNLDFAKAKEYRSKNITLKKLPDYNSFCESVCFTFPNYQSKTPSLNEIEEALCTPEFKMLDTRASCCTLM